MNMIFITEKEKQSKLKDFAKIVGKTVESAKYTIKSKNVYEISDGFDECSEDETQETTLVLYFTDGTSLEII